MFSVWPCHTSSFKKYTDQGWVCNSVVEHLSSMHMALGPIPRITHIYYMLITKGQMLFESTSVSHSCRQNRIVHCGGLVAETESLDPEF